LSLPEPSVQAFPALFALDLTDFLHSMGSERKHQAQIMFQRAKAPRNSIADFLIWKSSNAGRILSATSLIYKSGMTNRDAYTPPALCKSHHLVNLFGFLMEDVVKWET
jgi:hypothetical protein